MTFNGKKPPFLSIYCMLSSHNDHQRPCVTGGKRDSGRYITYPLQTAGGGAEVHFQICLVESQCSCHFSVLQGGGSVEKA